MRPTTRTALATFALGFGLCAPALAQDRVTVFEDAPSIEQLPQSSYRTRGRDNRAKSKSIAATTRGRRPP